MKILIVGAGMYVTGRNQTGSGTILSSLAEISKHSKIDKVTIIAKNRENKEIIATAVNRINKTINSHLKVQYQTIDIFDTDTYSQFLSKECFDGAIVSVPDHLHYQATKTILEKKVHCLVVKPLTPTLAEALDLHKIQKQNNVYAAVEFHKRFDETNLYIKKSLNEKILGKILYFSVDYSQRISIPKDVFTSWAEKTNIFQYLGVHYVDLIYFLTNYHPIKISTIGVNGRLKEFGLNTFDSVHATVIWKNSKKDDEFYSHFNISWADPNTTSALSDQKYKVVGTKGRIECDQKNRGLELVHENLGIQQINPYFSEYLPDPNGNLEFSGYGHKSIALFYNDILNIKNSTVKIDDLNINRPTFNQALISTAVIDASNKSLQKEGQWENINDLSKK